MHSPEELHMIIKRSALKRIHERTIRGYLDHHQIPFIEAVAVEADWPIYEQTWDSIERMMTGRPQRIEELVAYVERINEGVKRYSTRDSGFKVIDLIDIVNESPETSLARLRAEWQSEVLRHAREMCEGLTGNQIRNALDELLNSGGEKDA